MNSPTTIARPGDLQPEATLALPRQRALPFAGQLVWLPFTNASLPAVVGNVWSKCATETDDQKHGFAAASVHRFISLYGENTRLLWAPMTEDESAAYDAEWTRGAA